MIGALVAFGTDPGLALVAVLAYRVFAFWLPIAPGALAYVKLRKRVAAWELEDAEGERPCGPACCAGSRAPRVSRSWPTPASAVASTPWKASAASSTIRTSRSACHEMAEQMQSAQSLAWADNAIKLAVDMTVAAINRVNLQGNAEQQAQQIRSVMATVFPEAVTLVREARQGLS